MAKFVDYIPYKNETWPIRISYYAIKKFQEETGKEVEEIDKDISLLEVLLWYGLVAGHTAEGRPMTLKREEMEFILDESLEDFNNLMMGFFPISGDNKRETKKK